MNHLSQVIKYLFIAAFVSSLISSPSYAVKPDEDSAVSQNFKKVGRSFRSVRSAKTAEELLPIFESARQALVANKSEVPSFMEEGTEQYDEFQKGLDDTIARLDEAIALAQSGDFEGALEKFNSFRGAKKEYHDKFELED